MNCVIFNIINVSTPVRRQAIIRTDTDLLSVDPREPTSAELRLNDHISWKKIYLQYMTSKCQPLWPSVNVLIKSRYPDYLVHDNFEYVPVNWKNRCRDGSGPLTRCANLLVAHAPGMAGTFSPPPASKETAREDSRHASRHVRHAYAVMHVGIANPRWRGKRSRHSKRMRNRQFGVSGKRAIEYVPSDMSHPWYDGIYLTNKSSHFSKGQWYPYSELFSRRFFRE